jgi:hypothetical protein
MNAKFREYYESNALTEMSIDYWMENQEEDHTERDEEENLLSPEEIEEFIVTWETKYGMKCNDEWRGEEPTREDIDFWWEEERIEQLDGTDQK